MKRAPFAAAVLVLLALGCANRFGQISSGMTSAEVAQVMRSEPSRTEQFADGYTALYYGPDRCVLMQGDRVVGKDESRVRVIVASSAGAASERTPARCMPPVAPGP